MTQGQICLLVYVALDVKTTKYVTGTLLFKSVESFKSPIAVLCVEIDANTMGIAGWINRKDFAAKCCEFINPKIKNKTGRAYAFTKTNYNHLKVYGLKQQN